MSNPLVKVNPLATALKARSNITYTENGAETYASTLNDVLDFFYLAPARQGEDNLPLFEQAWNDNPYLALKAAFYIRDARGGKKQKKTFRDILAWLRKHEPKVFDGVVSYVPEYGMWKDILPFVDSRAVQNLVIRQLNADTAAGHPSLLGKWMPSENATSQETKALAKKWREVLNIKPREYRKTLTQLRKRIGVVEAKMSAQEWDDIIYERVPAKAFMNYRKAFEKHDTSRFTAFIENALENPNAKSIKTGTLYPHEIGSKLLHGSHDKSLEAMWVNLPNFFGDEQRNVLVVVDTSGSMDLQAAKSGYQRLDIAASLGMYCAERNQGAFHNIVVTFSRHPVIHNVTGETLRKRLHDIAGINNRAAENTDIQATFKCILDLAIASRAAPEDMPSSVVIISDMEFDSCADGTNLKGIQNQYAQAGYPLPMLIFWNVDAKTNQFPALANEKGVYLVSGASAETIGKVLQAKAKTPLELMLEVLHSERYNFIDAI